MRTFIYGEQKFSYHLQKAPYFEALQRCWQYQANLLVINSPDIQEAVMQHLTDGIGILPPDRWESPVAPGYWIGGSDVIKEGMWQWLDKSKIPTEEKTSGFENWYKLAGYDEPNAGSLTEDCLYISSQVNDQDLPDALGAWFDGDCSTWKYYICQGSALPEGKV